MEGLIRQPADPPQRMTGRYPVLDRDVGEQRARLLLLTSHQAWGGCSIFAGVGGFFSELLDDLLDAEDDLQGLAARPGALPGCRRERFTAFCQRLGATLERKQ
jgi:hypothetical protein